MSKMAWPTIRHFKAYAIMAGVAALLLGLTVLRVRTPLPRSAPAAAWNSQWRCAEQPEGDPICVRNLPPAARPSPARSSHEP